MATQSYEIAPAGPPVTVTTHAAGENARLFFDGVAGQRVALRMSNVAMGASNCCSAQVSIWKPDGSNLVYPTLVGTNGGFVDTRALPVSGRYSMLVDPQGTAFGSMTLTLYDVPPDVTDSISPGGPAVTVSMGPVPGQNAILRFDGTAGQRVSVRLSPVTIGTSTCCSAQVSIWKPDGSNLVYPTLVGTNGGFLDTRALPVSGSYTILVDPQKTDLGAMTLALYDVPPDVDASITPGGPPVAVSMGPVPGQNARLRFFGLAGQRVSVGMSNVTIGTSGCCSAQVSIWKPDGSNLVYPTLVGTTGGFLDTRVLPVSGMYTILVDPQSTSLGSMTLTLSDVPPDASGSIVAGGGPVVPYARPDPGAERNASVRRHRRPADQPAHEQRHDWHVHVLWNQDLAHKAGWDEPDPARARRHHRRHDDRDLARDGSVLDPGRPPGRKHRRDYADAVAALGRAVRRAILLGASRLRATRSRRDRGSRLQRPPGRSPPSTSGCRRR